MTTITLELPEEVAAKAREAGLLRPERLAAVLEDELRHEAMKKFLGDAPSARDMNGAPLDDDAISSLVSAEIKSARLEQKKPRQFDFQATRNRIHR